MVIASEQARTQEVHVLEEHPEAQDCELQLEQDLVQS